jgi:hypothetical protein
MACLPIISKDGCCIGFSHILSINTPTRLLCQIIQNPESEKENWWRYFIKED